tara:strand:+ start:4157 stop:4390 length:234 start_codon:yes stop_codon:yes gene_type:complete
MSKVEKIEVINIIEINLIRKQLQDQPKLLEVFDHVCRCANKQLNEEAGKRVTSPPVENEEFVLELDSDTDDDSVISL